MFSHRFTSCAALVLSLIFSVQPAGAQQSSVRNTLTGIQNNPSRHYYAVIGAVGVPGVYEYSSGLPTLADVIHDASGLTSEASGTFRIVREGKISRQMIYSSDSELVLLSGDILVLDNFPTGATGERDSSVVRESQSLVQIVAVNLIDRPVVLRLLPEDATLERLVSLLNQSPRVIPTIKVLHVKTSKYVGPGKGLAKFRLLSDSVLIFDPSIVRIDQFLELPPTYKPKVRTASYRQISGFSSADSLGENLKGAIQLAADSSTQQQSSQLGQADKMMTWASPSLESVPHPHANPSYEVPPVWTAVKEDDLSMDPPEDGWDKSTGSPTVPVPTDPLAILENEKEMPDSAKESTVPEAASKNTTPTETRANPGWIVFGCVGLLGAGWLLRRKLQQRIVKPNFNFQPVKKKTGGILDSLIENRLQLVEESMAFPEGLELQIPAVSTSPTILTPRTAPPVSERKFRVGSSHQIPRPRFPPVFEEPEPELPSSVTKTTQIDAVPETPAVVSGLSGPVEILQKTRVVSGSEALLEFVGTETEIDQTRFHETEPNTVYVCPAMWLEPASVSEPAVDIQAVEIHSETPSQNESASMRQTHRIDSPQTTSLRPHTQSSGWVLDRVLVALHGVTRQ